MKTNTKLAFLFLVFIAVDQLAKNVFAFTSFCNKNIAWNIPVHAGIFYFVWIAIVASLIYIFFKSKNIYPKIFLIIILSGAISNIIDRVRLGCVVDYIDLKFWPVFNLADVYITVGIILLLILNLKFEILSES